VRAARGFTIAETIVVALILGMMLTAIAGAMVPMFAAPDRAQAKSDSLGSAASGMYLIERDLRESDAGGVFACVGLPAECGDGSLDVGDSAIAMPTALASGDLGAPFMTIASPAPNAGRPDWKGFIVYWQATPGGFVYRAYEPVGGMSQLIDSDPPNRAALQTLADAAVASASIDPSRLIAMRSIATLAAFVDHTADVTSLHIVSSGLAGGHSNTTTFDDDVFARN
jgi:hypothetical protein